MRVAVLLVAAFLAFVVWAGSPVPVAANDGGSISTVNGSVTAAAGQTYDNLSTVNGSVRVGRGVTANNAKTVNGEISVEDDARIGSLSTVNGALDIGEGVTIARGASTVNGGIEIGKRTRVNDDVSTVSGDIELEGAEVRGKLMTRNGDIELSDGARVSGGIHVKSSRDSNWGLGNRKPQEVRICGTCVVDGELRFDRPVVLRVEEGAKIGPVIGDSVTRR